MWKRKTNSNGHSQLKAEILDCHVPSSQHDDVNSLKSFSSDEHRGSVPTSCITNYSIAIE